MYLCKVAIYYIYVQLASFHTKYACIDKYHKIITYKINYFE